LLGRKYLSDWAKKIGRILKGVKVMVEDINFLLNQTPTTSSSRDLRGASHEHVKPRQIEGLKEELNKLRMETDQQSVDKTESLKSKIKFFQKARKETEEVPKELTELQSQEANQDIAPAERRELQSNRQEVSKDARAESRNPRSQGPSGSNELVRTSEGSARGPQENSNDDPSAGSDLANQLVMLSTINRIEKFQNDARSDSIKESVKLAREDDIEEEQELLASQTRKKPTIHDLAQDASEIKGSESLEQLIVTDKVTKADLEDNRLATNDIKTQEHLNEEKAAEDADAFRNKPKLDMTADVIEPAEIQVDSIEEGLNTNSLPGPRPLESRDANGSSLETERGQNISKLI
jgi:hypothetical protein